LNTRTGDQEILNRRIGDQEILNRRIGDQEIKESRKSGDREITRPSVPASSSPALLFAALLS
jgi:hypothetical protein